ncbi:MAG TPA: protein-L-isoaspartate(D-aspartate) O-methyltransferase [Rhizomicrobium sp.]|nr:protein-L-isoaspartate(D-aspartate) O-methyltransferase [Rhizomicrobium sp.]
MDFSQARDHMVEAQIARRGVRDSKILDAMRSVPREFFVAERFRAFSYEDGPLPIAEGQSISQPYVVAAMLEAAELEADDQVLEIGAGSGYAAAILSRIVRKVYAVERQAALGQAARERLRALGYDNVELKTGDGSGGWPQAAPFDAIIVSAASPSIPQALKIQLAVGAHLVIPVGTMDEQRLIRVTRVDETQFQQDDLGPVRFVKLIGASGWDDSETLPSR